MDSVILNQKEGQVLVILITEYRFRGNYFR